MDKGGRVGGRTGKQRGRKRRERQGKGGKGRQRGDRRGGGAAVKSRCRLQHGPNEAQWQLQKYGIGCFLSEPTSQEVWGTHMQHDTTNQPSCRASTMLNTPYLEHRSKYLSRHLEPCKIPEKIPSTLPGVSDPPSLVALPTGRARPDGSKVNEAIRVGCVHRRSFSGSDTVTGRDP